MHFCIQLMQRPYNVQIFIIYIFLCILYLYVGIGLYGIELVLNTENNTLLRVLLSYRHKHLDDLVMITQAQQLGGR